jgi:hypothetical protein
MTRMCFCSAFDARYSIPCTPVGCASVDSMSPLCRDGRNAISLHSTRATVDNSTSARVHATCVRRQGPGLSPVLITPAMHLAMAYSLSLPLFFRVLVTPHAPPTFIRLHFIRRRWPAPSSIRRPSSATSRTVVLGEVSECAAAFCRRILTGGRARACLAWRQVWALMPVSPLIASLPLPFSTRSRPSHPFPFPFPALSLLYLCPPS